MEVISGVFSNKMRAEHAVSAARDVGIPADRITLLTPGSGSSGVQSAQSVPTDAAEQPGMGKAMGALAGGAVGLSGGSLLMAMIPGVGVITAMGLLGAAIVGAAGAVIGGAAGDKAEKAGVQGVPEDEIFVYEDALRQGRSVVIVMSEHDGSAPLLRDLLKAKGAESVDAAREQWWIGLRSAEESHYAKSGKNFSEDEEFYRLGFEAALNSKTRCMEFDQVSGAMNATLEDVKSQHPGKDVEEPFTRGYQRGRDYYQRLCDGKRAA